MTSMPPCFASAAWTKDSCSRVRIEQAPLGTVDLDQWSGIILGGGPFQASDPEDAKSATQRRVESELSALLDDVVERDFPFLGACYGIGTLGRHQGAVIDQLFTSRSAGFRSNSPRRVNKIVFSAEPGRSSAPMSGTRRRSASCRRMR